MPLPSAIVHSSPRYQKNRVEPMPNSPLPHPLDDVAVASLARAQRQATKLFIEHCRQREVSPKQPVVHAGDHADSLYLLIEGSLSVVVEDDNGREMVLAQLNDGDFFGEMALFTADSVRNAWVTTRSECSIGEMPYEQFMKLADQHPLVLMEVTRQLSERLATTSRKVLDLAFLDVTGRVARALIELSEQPDALTHAEGRVILSTRQGIAKMVGCSREMASRVLKSLEEQDLIHSDGRRILIYHQALKQSNSPPLATTNR